MSHPVEDASTGSPFSERNSRQESALVTVSPSHRVTVSVFRAWLAHPDRDVFRSRFDGSFGSPTRSGLVRLNRAAAWVYRTYVAMLSSVLTRHDELGLLDGRVQEPRIGNPLIVRYRGSMLSQDLCNSVPEFYRVVGRLPAGAGRAPLVAELGAGYGRLAFVFLNAMPEVRYCIIDIPPALCLAQWYLTTVLPGVAAFRFREFSAFDEVREEFEDATLLFLAPHQIELLPPKTFDGFVNISSLHEMPGAQIRNYLEQIDRLTAGVFYTKQWRVSHMPAHGDPIGEHDYPVPSHWTVLFHRRHPFHRRFFEAMYRIPVRS